MVCGLCQNKNKGYPLIKQILVCRVDAGNNESIYMVEHSERVMVVYDGREKGGTVRTIRFAHQMKKELREIPMGEIHLPKH